MRSQIPVRMSPNVRLRFLGLVALRLFWYGDTIAIRVLMAGASLVFAAIVLVNPETFDRRAFYGMGEVITQFGWGRAVGPGPFWALLFTIHGLGVFWRIVDQRVRIYWAVAINWLGFVLWLTEVVLTTASIGEMAAGNALEIPALVALFVALARTGLNDEKVGA